MRAAPMQHSLFDSEEKQNSSCIFAAKAKDEENGYRRGEPQRRPRRARPEAIFIRAARKGCRHRRAAFALRRAWLEPISAPAARLAALPTLWACAWWRRARWDRNKNSSIHRVSPAS